LLQNTINILIYYLQLNLQPLHYKCLIGEFDGFFDQKKYAEAYKLVPTIRENFPLSPYRLGNVFISAVYSYNLQDIPTFYSIFQKLDDRPPELVKLFSAALLTAGRFYIKSKDVQKAGECFDLGIMVTGPSIPYIDTIVRELLKMNAGEKETVSRAKPPCRSESCICLSRAAPVASILGSARWAGAAAGATACASCICRSSAAPVASILGCAWVDAAEGGGGSKDESSTPLGASIGVLGRRRSVNRPFSWTIIALRDVFPCTQTLLA
jgi:hypothetical protein